MNLEHLVQKYVKYSINNFSILFTCWNYILEIFNWIFNLKLVLPVLLFKKRLTENSQLHIWLTSVACIILLLGSTVVYIQKYQYNIYYMVQGIKKAFIYPWLFIIQMVGTSVAIVTVEGCPYWLVGSCWSEPPGAPLTPPAPSLWTWTSFKIQFLNI